VVKTERCAFSEYNVFPGHGMKMVRKDGQPLIFGTAKSKRLYCQRLKPSKLMWTQVRAAAQSLQETKSLREKKNIKLRGNA
jgi:large subunit ribosomal protein L24e